jgi:hypothetical protein
VFSVRLLGIYSERFKTCFRGFMPVNLGAFRGSASVSREMMVRGFNIESYS